MTDRTVEFSLGGTLKFHVEEPQPRPGSIVTLTYDGFTVTAKGDHMAYILPTDKAVHVKVAYIDAKGNPAAIDGDVTWTSSNESIARVQVEGPNTAIVIPAVDLGQVQITAIADADIGAGITELITLMDVEIVGGQAVAGTIMPVGEPVSEWPEPHK